MRFYNLQHKHYCGIDLHARAMYLCVIDQQGEILLHRNMRTTPESFLKAVAPYREDLVVGVESIFDLCRAEGIAFVLGHALYMKAIHGGKAKNDRIDSNKIATLLRGGTMPRAYVYPPGMRACCAAVCISSANAASCWPILRTPTASTTMMCFPAS